MTTIDPQKVIIDAIHKWPNRTCLVLPGPTDLAPQLAERIAAEFGLRQEWAVSCDGVQLRADSRERAQEMAKRILKRFWDTYKSVSGAILIEPKPQVETRWVTAWMVDTDE